MPTFHGIARSQRGHGAECQPCQPTAFGHLRTLAIATAASPAAVTWQHLSSLHLGLFTFCPVPPLLPVHRMVVGTHSAIWRMHKPGRTGISVHLDLGGWGPVSQGDLSEGLLTQLLRGSQRGGGPDTPCGWWWPYNGSGSASGSSWTDLPSFLAHSSRRSSCPGSTSKGKVLARRSFHGSAFVVSPGSCKA